MFKSELPLELRSKSTNEKILVKKRRDFYGNKLIDNKLIQFLFPTAYVETLKDGGNEIAILDIHRILGLYMEKLKRYNKL